MRLTKKGQFDKRYKKLEEIERNFWQQYGALIGTTILGFMTGAILAQTLWNAFHPEIISPKGLGVARVPRVYAMERTVTPTPTKGRRHLNYKHMPKYDYIISELQMLYTNWEDAADLQSRENGFNHKAINPTSGACGLSQALPCSKLPCTLGDIKCDLKWQKEYIAGSYGTVTKALQFQVKNNWY